MIKFLVVTIALLSFSQNTVAQSLKVDVSFLQKLQNSVNPDLPENSHFSPLMKEKLRWIKRESDAKRLFLVWSESFPKNIPPTVWMLSGDNIKNERRILVSVSIFVAFSKTLSEVELRNLYALCLVHEAIHFEFQLKNPGRPPDLIAGSEEIWVWHKWLIGAVRPLRYKGYALPPLFLEVEDILRSCKDDWECPEFVRAVLPLSIVKAK